MSYSVTITKDDETEPVEIMQHYPEQGGGIPTFISTACIGITYNYSEFYEDVFGKHGLRIFDGMPVALARGVLNKGIAQLGRMKTGNYFDKTAGNAGAALDEIKLLIEHAQHFHPDTPLRLRVGN